jgi:LysM repeat protein
MKYFIILIFLLSSCCTRFSPTHHIVKEGDSWKSISIRYYGSELYIKDLQQANTKLEINKKILIPVIYFK